MLLLIDNYDSFTYNLAQLIQAQYREVKVVKNDQISIAEIQSLNTTYIVISPGPGAPHQSGICQELIRMFHKQIPILGVCLGHQCLAAVFNSQIGPANEILHGKTSRIQHSAQGLFQGLPQNISVARYHSLAIEQLSPQFDITAQANDQTIMAIKHKQYPLFGVQFHPESFLSEYGSQIISNFLQCHS